MHAYIHTYINFVKNVVYSSSERSLVSTLAKADFIFAYKKIGK